MDYSKIKKALLPIDQILSEIKGHAAISVTAALLCASQGLHAATSVTSMEDTMITVHTGISGPDQTNGTSSVLYNVGSDIDGGIYTTVPLFKFDLTPYAGATITGAATVSLFYSGSANFNTVIGSIHPVLVNWTEASTTWNNFGASPGPNASTDYGPALETISYFPGTTLTFNIPGSVIQGWIDAPATNNGLILIMNGRDITFSSKESTGTAPTLTFIPEPSAALLAALTLPLALFRRKRA